MTPYAESISSLTRESAPHGRFLNALFRLLDHYAVCYCVLHSYDALPERISTDLDIAVHHNDAAKLPFVVGALAQEGYRPVQCFNYALGAYYFVFAWTEDSRILFVAVDVILDHRRRGLMLASGRELVAGRRTLRNFYVPNPAVEFSYLISKKTLKGDMGHRQEQRLKVLAAELGEHRTEQLAWELFGNEWAPRVARLCIEGNASSIPGQLQRRLWWNVFMRRPFASAGGLVPEAVRLIRRWRHQTGFFIAVLGPDGAGKSALLNEITRTLSPAFRSVRRFHWRPGLVWRTNTTAVTDPHGRPRRGTWASLPRLGAWLADFFIGYWAIMRPGLARGRFIVFDRYFDDLYADPRRYRYGGPSWLVPFCRRIRPEPDLVIVMDAPEAVLISRKAEITPDEITRLRRTYAELSAGFRDSVVVDASRPLEEVAIRVSREILSRLALRFPALYPSAPRSGEAIRQAMSQFAGTECIFAPPEDKRRTIVLHAGERHPAPDLPGLHYGFAALPSRKNPRWLVPLGNTGAALAAMEIYSPYKFPARLFKHCLMTAISSRVPVWERDRVLLDCVRPLQLEALVAQITGERRPVFCFSIGKNTRFAKLTVQAMRPGGEILGYFKFPLTAAAVERVRQEREALDRLRRCPALRDQVPAVLYSGEWRDGYILFQSAAHGRPGPARISELQEEFLHVLATVNRIDMNARVLVQKVAARWESASKSLRSDWQQLAERALEIADRRLDGAAVRCGATHGDFAPWNTKVVGRSLFVFDWEAARWDCPVLWDRFHFDVQTASLLGRRLRPFSTYRDRDKRRPLLLLYLLDSVSALVAEGVNEQEVDIRYRKALLASLLKPAAIGI